MGMDLVPHPLNPTIITIISGGSDYNNDSPKKPTAAAEFPTFAAACDWYIVGVDTTTHMVISSASGIGSTRSFQCRRNTAP